MSEPLTAAGAEVHEFYHPRGRLCGPGDECWLRVRLNRAERQAAARAVDEALSVERVMAVLHHSGTCAASNGSCGGPAHHLGEARAFLRSYDAVALTHEWVGAGCACGWKHDGQKRGSPKAQWEAHAAALVAHLRGPRPEGEG